MAIAPLKTMVSTYVGEIRVFAGSYAPIGWAICNGQLLSVPDNQALFNAIGTSYGGDGVTTFGVPNLVKSVPVDAGNGFNFAGTGMASLVVGAPLVPLTYLIALVEPDMTNPYIGEVRTFGFSFAPDGWSFCEGQILGQILPPAANAALFHVIGNTYGGDGKATFALPDLRGAGVQASASGPTGPQIGFLAMNFCIATVGVYPMPS